MKKLFLSILAVGALAPTSHAQTQIEWSDVTLGVAHGTFGAASVSLSTLSVGAGLASVFVTNNSSTRYNGSNYSPALPTSDTIEIFAYETGAINSWTFTFDSVILNPRVHFSSLASTVTFPGISLTKMSGEPSFTVAGDTLVGALDDLTSVGHDANGTVQLNGAFSSFTFTAQPLGHFTDGINIQVVQVSAAPEPSTLIFLGLGILGVIPWRGHRRRRG